MHTTTKRKETSRLTQIDTDICTKNAHNKFDLVLIAATRAREIRAHHPRSLKFEHTHAAVTATLEIQSGKVGREYLKKLGTTYSQRRIPHSK